MKKIILILVAAFLTSFVYAGMVLTVENDLVSGTDDDYTHGTDIGWGWYEDGLPCIVGVRSWFYTPNDISISEPQPKDRPWCGITAAYYEKTQTLGTSIYFKHAYEIGVQGPLSGAESQQTIVHEWTDSETPMGWNNQFDNEPVLQVGGKIWKPYRLDNNGMGIEFRGVTGGDIGTQIDKIWVGTGVEAGWNVPKTVVGGIGPKANMDIWNRMSVTVIAEYDINFVIHNATITDSLFHPEQNDLKLKRNVGEGRIGSRIGINSFWLTYMYCQRTKEYYGQKNDMDWGELRLSFGGNF